MLVSKRALELVCGRLDAAAGRCAELAGAHRSTVMAGRTLLQHAVPITFGLKCAVWLVALMDAGDGLERIRRDRLAAQLGGAAGTLAALGDGGVEVARRFAHELDLREPELPWHADRQRIAELGSALASAAGAAAKIAGDIVLLSQTEVGEVAEGAGGGSSTMPQKRNPVASVRAIACARQARGHASVLLAAVDGEHERAAGAWQSEWAALSGALACAGGAAAHVAEALSGLEVEAERMRQNLDATGGLVLAERVSNMLAPRLGRAVAHEVVARRGGDRLVPLGAGRGRARRAGSGRGGCTARPGRLSWLRRGADRPRPRAVRGTERRQNVRVHHRTDGAGRGLLLVNSLGSALELWEPQVGPSGRAVPARPLRPARARRHTGAAGSVHHRGAGGRRARAARPARARAGLDLRPLARRGGRDLAGGQRPRPRRPAADRVRREPVRHAGRVARASRGRADGRHRGRRRRRPRTVVHADVRRRQPRRGGGVPGGVLRGQPRGLRRMLRGARRLGCEPSPGPHPRAHARALGVGGLASRRQTGHARSPRASPVRASRSSRTPPTWPARGSRRRSPGPCSTT